MAKKEAAAKSSGVKENEQDPRFAGKVVAVDRGPVDLPEADADLETQKARGQTESQKQIREYHEGRFQTHEPTANKRRDKADAVREDSE